MVVVSRKTKLRVERTKYLNGNCPKITMINDNMYSYDYIEGEMLSNITDESLMIKFLNDCQSTLWSVWDSDIKYSEKNFLEDCEEMYEVKTRDFIIWFRTR